MENKYIYFFDEGSSGMEADLGIRGVKLCEMVKINMPIPKGFIITREACEIYFLDRHKFYAVIVPEIMLAIKKLGRMTGKRFGNKDNPLLLSVRSSLCKYQEGIIFGLKEVPVLNIGLNDDTIEGLAVKFNNEKCAMLSYAKLIETFGQLVINMDENIFTNINKKYLKELGTNQYEALSLEKLKAFLEDHRMEYIHDSLISFPQKPKEQLLRTITAFIRSWNNRGAIQWREKTSMKNDYALSIIVQEMVYGNADSKSGIGYMFTRDYNTGKDDMIIRALQGLQSTDYNHKTISIDPVKEANIFSSECLQKLSNIGKTAEAHFKDMQEISFVIQQDEPHVIASKSGYRRDEAAFNIAMDLVEQRIITKEEAVGRINMIGSKYFYKDKSYIYNENGIKKSRIIGKGIPNLKGTAYGRVCFSPEKARFLKINGDKVILVVDELSEEKFKYLRFIDGILTSESETSPIGIAAYLQDICCLSSCRISILKDLNGCFIIGSSRISEGEFISIDGINGDIYVGMIELFDRNINGKYSIYLEWLEDAKSTLKGGEV